jgi:PAS domain S-box-containing protein
MEQGVKPQTRRPQTTFRLPPDPARLLRARHRVADHLLRLGARPDAIADVVLAVHEAMANAVRHSGASEDLEVEVALEGADVLARVTDHGCDFDPSALDPERPPDPLQEGGRGLYLISRITDALDIATGERTDVRMVKRDALDEAAGSSGRLEPRLRQSIEEVPEGFTTLDWEYRITLVNRYAQDLYGLAEEALVGRGLWELLPALGHSPLRQRFEDAMELGIPSICEYDSPTLGRFVEFRIYPTTSGVSFSMCDIEERKRREMAHEDGRRHAELLAGTAARLLSAEEPQRVVDDLCGDVMRHLGCHVFFNYLVDARAGCLVLNAYAGIDSETAREIELMDFGVAVCGCAALRAERVVAEDIQHTGDDMPALVRSYGVQAYAAHPLLARGEVIGTLSFGTRDRPRFTDEELAVMKTVADHVAIAIDRDRAERELRRRELEAAALGERSRLARDLHDSVTQALFAASLKAEALLLNEADVSPEACRAVEQVRRLNRGALAQMRTMLLELRDEPLEAVPVQQLLRYLVEATESRSTTDVTLTVAGDVPLPRPLHVAVYRIAQEALNNVVRHAMAEQAWVDLELEPGAGTLTVRDDGRGCDLSAAVPGRLGLRFMNERAAEAGAGLGVESRPGEGTTVRLWWPPGPGGPSGRSAF